MLARMSSAQFGRWMAFYQAEFEIHKEENERAALEREALAGVDEMRGR
jgi:hypothetical protein